jgi:hypothetical protein
MRKDNKKNRVFLIIHDKKILKKMMFIFLYKNLYLNPKNAWNPYDG